MACIMSSDPLWYENFQNLKVSLMIQETQTYSFKMWKPNLLYFSYGLVTERIRANGNTIKGRILKNHRKHLWYEHLWNPVSIGTNLTRVWQWNMVLTPIYPGILCWKMTWCTMKYILKCINFLPLFELHCVASFQEKRTPESLNSTTLSTSRYSEWF